MKTKLCRECQQNVELKDNYSMGNETVEDFVEPCNTCKHNHGGIDEHPCYDCIHSQDN